MLATTLVNYIAWNMHMQVIAQLMRVWGGGAIGVYIGIVTPIYRYIVFEVIYKSMPYISDRHHEATLGWYNLYRLIRLGNCIVLGVVSHLIVPTDGIIIFRYISPSDLCKCMLSFFVTDVLFYFSHRAMHNRLVYSLLGHQEHHKLHKPTSHMVIENFTIADGLSHIMVFYVSYVLMLQSLHIDTFLFCLLYSQWIIIGQLQHGGKDIQLDSIPGFEFIRRGIVKETMCFLHDKHHSLYNRNYSMTGIPDKLFGTIR